MLVGRRCPSEWLHGSGQRLGPGDHLARVGDDTAQALSELGGPTALEHKLDGFRVQLHKDCDIVRAYTGMAFSIQHTTNFGTWATLFSGTDADGSYLFTDTSPTPPGGRFYRLLMLP